MIFRSTRTLTALVMAGFMIIISSAQAQNAQFAAHSGMTMNAQQSRAQSEKVIRTVLYESALSSLTGDVKMYRRHISKRTRELQRLVYEGMRELPDYAEMLTDNDMDTVDKFIDATFVQGASQYAKLSRAEIEQKAHAQADGKLTFLNDNEAVLTFGGSTLRVVFEDGAWKVDEVEASKKLYLDNFKFTPETRAKIEKL